MTHDGRPIYASARSTHYLFYDASCGDGRDAPWSSGWFVDSAFPNSLAWSPEPTAVPTTTATPTATPTAIPTRVPTAPTTAAPTTASPTVTPAPSGSCDPIYFDFEDTAIDSCPSGWTLSLIHI